MKKLLLLTLITMDFANILLISEQLSAAAIRQGSPLKSGWMERPTKPLKSGWIERPIKPSSQESPTESFNKPPLARSGSFTPMAPGGPGSKPQKPALPPLPSREKQLEQQIAQKEAKLAQLQKCLDEANSLQADISKLSDELNKIQRSADAQKTIKGYLKDPELKSIFEKNNFKPEDVIDIRSSGRGEIITLRGFHGDILRSYNFITKKTTYEVREYPKFN